MGMRGNPQVCVVHVNLLRPFILVVEIHDRFQIIALDMGETRPRAIVSISVSLFRPFLDTNLIFPTVNNAWY